MGRKKTLDILRRAYEGCFRGSNDGVIVLAHLAQECFASKETFDANDRQSAYNDGKRSVWLGIQHTLGMTEDDITRVAAQASRYFEEDI